MGGQGGYVRCSGLRALDQRLNDRDMRRVVLMRLLDGATLDDLMDANDLAMFTDGQKEHLRTGWLGGGADAFIGGFSREEKEEIVRQAYVRALDEAIQHDLTIETNLYCAWGPSSRFEIGVHRGDKQVSVMVLAFQTAPREAEDIGTVDESWVVCSDREVARQRDFIPSYGASVERHDHSIVTVAIHDS